MHPFMAFGRCENYIDFSTISKISLYVCCRIEKHIRPKLTPLVHLGANRVVRKKVVSVSGKQVKVFSFLTYINSSFLQFEPLLNNFVI